MDNNEGKSLNEYKYDMFKYVEDYIYEFIGETKQDKSFPNTNQEKKMKDYVIKHWDGTRFSPSEWDDNQHWDVNKREHLIYMTTNSITFFNLIHFLLLLIFSTYQGDVLLLCCR